MQRQLLMNQYTISKLMEEAHQTAIEKGWWGEDGKDNRNFPEQIALMHSELSEVLEEYRKGKSIDDIYYNIDSPKPEGIPIEFADLFIRVFDTCARYNIDLEKALEIKLAYNKTRPHKHGGKVC